MFVKYDINLELKQKKREENGDSYDPICLSNMESNDTSWMDIQESFEVSEEGCNIIVYTKLQICFICCE